VDEAEHQRQTDDAYRAVGRYVVEFSRLIFHMRFAVARRLTQPGDGPLLGEMALGEATAYPIANAFFGICRVTNELDADEQKVASKLRSDVKAAIEARNDVAHGDWWIGLARKGAETIHDPIVIRIHPDGSKGPVDLKELTAGELDGMSESLVQLRNLVAEFGEICLGPDEQTHLLAGVHVRDIFVIEGPKKSPKVVRNGPMAGLTDVVQYR
jgi:hypothetical protein